MAKMTKAQTEDWTATYNRFIEENTAGLTSTRIEEIMDVLHRHETTLRRLYIDECNRELTAYEKQKIDNTEKKVELLAYELGFPVEMNGDPRGHAIKFYLPSKRYNSFDGETWRINW